MGIGNLISLLGGIALFLFGMSLMGESLKKVAGNKLELVLYRLSSTPLKGVLLGTGVTAVIQSSSATSVMVVGFVNSGMMTVKQAIGIVLGAILGTSITGWIVCLSALDGAGWLALFSTTTLTGIVAVIGILLRMFCHSRTKIYTGDILLGFAVLMYGMSAMSGAVEPLRENEVFLSILTTFANPVLGILVGLVFTSILQSASASVGILQALSMTGAIPFRVALPIIMGIGIGAAVPVLLSALGANLNGKRTAFVYLLIDALGVIIWATIFYTVNALVHFSFMEQVMDPFSIAGLNTLYRLATVLLLSPAIGLLERIVCLLFPDKSGQPEPDTDTEPLEERFISHPALAIEQSRTVIHAMARTAQENLRAACALFDSFTPEGYASVEQMEQKVDRYEDRLGSYLVKLTEKELTARQNGDISKFLHTISDFERISDHALNIAQAARELDEKQLQFSDAAAHELQVLRSAVEQIVSLTIDAFVENQLDTAARVEPLEEIIDNLCDEMKLHHVNRLQKGACTLSQGFVFNDLLTNYERIADHCSNIAVAMIELDSESFDTHEYLRSLKELKTEAFAQYLEEYTLAYHL